MRTTAKDKLTATALRESQSEWLKRVGVNVRALREKQCMTRDELCAAACVPSGSIASLERGEHEARHRSLVRIAEALGTTVGVLTGEVAK